MSKIVLFWDIKFSISTVSMSKTVLFQTIQFGISIQINSLWHRDRTLSGATTLGQSGPGSDGNEGVLRTILVYWPPTRPNMPFQRRRKCIFHWRGWAWLTVWDRVKIPQYTHRLMHGKRVTCVLHDSYFRLMTIKHVIPKTVEVTHSDGQSVGDIEWAIELLYNSVKTGSQLVWRPVWRVLETRPVGDTMR